jgi:hypothetical protein
MLTKYGMCVKPIGPVTDGVRVSQLVLRYISCYIVLTLNENKQTWWIMAYSISTDFIFTWYITYLSTYLPTYLPTNLHIYLPLFFKVGVFSSCDATDTWSWTAQGSLQYKKKMCLKPETGGANPRNDVKLVLDSVCDERKNFLQFVPSKWFIQLDYLTCMICQRVKGDGNLYAIYMPKENVSYIILTNFILEIVSILNCSFSSSSKVYFLLIQCYYRRKPSWTIPTLFKLDSSISSKLFSLEVQ